MSAAEDDKMWDSVADPLRRRRGFCPPTDDEAEAMFEAQKDKPPLSQEEAEKIVDRLLKKNKPGDEPTVRTDEPAGRARAIQAQPEYGSVCRNKGEEEPDTTDIEARLFQEMMDEHADDAKANDEA